MTVLYVNVGQLSEMNIYAMYNKIEVNNTEKTKKPSQKLVVNNSFKSTSYKNKIKKNNKYEKHCCIVSDTESV